MGKLGYSLVDWEYKRAFHMTGCTDRALQDRCAKRARELEEDSPFPDE
jgi:hypothetical protein